MKRLAPPLALALAATVAAASPLASAPRGAAALDGWAEVNEPARDFAVEDLGGRALRSDDLAGKIVVIDFWATWCSPCLRELPGLADYHRRLEGQTHVALLSFNVTDERADLEGFVEQRKVPFPVYLGDSLIGPYELVAFPTKIVLDLRGGAPGVIRFRREGYTSVESIEARVADLLAEPR
jgi:thiol-disulfide isomerase/thioredoxin